MGESVGQEMLGRAEQVLDGPELLVAQHGLDGNELDVGAVHEGAVEPGVLSGLVGVDLEARALDVLEVAAVAGVADERLVALLELAFQAFEDGLAFGCAAPRLVVVAADDIAQTFEPDLLGAVIDRLAPAAGGCCPERRANAGAVRPNRTGPQVRGAGAFRLSPLFIPSGLKEHAFY